MCMVLGAGQVPWVIACMKLGGRCLSSLRGIVQSSPQGTRDGWMHACMMRWDSERQRMLEGSVRCGTKQPSPYLSFLCPPPNNGTSSLPEAQARRLGLDFSPSSPPHSSFHRSQIPSSVQFMFLACFFTTITLLAQHLVSSSRNC